MDFVDICEELASQYGVLPHTIMRLPWTHVKTLWQSFMKRMRRRTDYEAALRGIGPETLFGGRPSHGISLPGPPPVRPEQDRDLSPADVTRLESMGFPVVVRKVDPKP